MTPLTPPREPRREPSLAGPRSLQRMREICPAFAEMEMRAKAAGLIKEDKVND